MMKVTNFLFFMFLSILATAQVLPLAVPLKTPQGQLDSYGTVKDITATFNQPVVALGEDSQQDSTACPLTLRPAIKGSCRWLGTQTVVFTPKDDFTKAVRYTVSIKKGFKSSVTGAVLPKAETWFFDTPRPQVMQTLPYDGEGWLNLKPQIIVVFNMPISPSVVYKYASLKHGNKTIPVKVDDISDELFEKNFKYSQYKRDGIFTVTPINKLSPDTQYVLTINKGLNAISGSLAMQASKTIKFSTYNKFNLVVAPSAQCLPFTPALGFTNPVSAGEIYKNITFEPELNFTTKDEDNVGWENTIEVNGQKRRVYHVPLTALDFKAGQQYKATLKADTTDIFGNKLGREIKFIWDNEGYCPAVNFKGGFGVIEDAYKAYHPVSAVNAGAIEVEKQRIDYTDFIPFYTKSQDANYCAKTALTGNFIKTIWQPNLNTPNIPLNTFFDLAPALEGKKTGIVFLQFMKPFDKDYGRECWQNSINNITNIGLTLKTSPKDILIWATYLSDGKPAKGKAVELRDSKNNVLWQGKTNRQGIAAAPGWGMLNFYNESDWRSPEVWAFVKDDESVAVISSRWDEGIQPWRFNINYEYNPPKQDLRTFIFTERGMYRQGESVYIKAIIRKFTDGLLSYSGLSKANITVSDPTGKTIVNRDIDLGADSALNYTYDIPAAAASGMWEIKITADGVSAYNNFKVEAIKAAEFKVDLIALAPQYTAGEQADFSVNANYMFGAPMAQADLRWHARLMPTNYSLKAYDGYNFSAWWLDRDVKEDILLAATAKLDEAGAATVKIDLPEVSVPSALYVEAGVISPQNQELFARKSITVLPANLLIGIKQTQNMVSAGEAVTSDIITLNAATKPVNAMLEAELIRTEYLSVKKTGLGGRLEWVSEENNVPVATATINTIDGKAVWDFVPVKPGSYRLTITGRDSDGRMVSSGSSFYVAAPGNAYWKQNDDDILPLTLDKTSYKPGEKAKLLIHSPYDKAQALITVERDGILESFTESVKGGAVIIPLSIKENYLPNVFISVVLTKGRGALPIADVKDGDDLGKPQAKFGYTQLTVAATERKIVTKISTDKPKYQPGQEVKINLATLDERGKGHSASVTIFAVDEGILAGFETPDIFSFFYNTEPLSVSTADNRLYLIGQRSFGQKGENRGGGGSDSKLGGVDLRSNFKFTPFYTATVNTDKKGKAQIAFTLPDNLTKFRIMAVAATERDFGSAQSFIEVAKPVMLKPVLPRFARVGDTFDCGFTIYNYTDADNLTINLAQEINGAVKFNEGGAVAVTLNAGASKNIMGSCTANKLGAATFAFSANSLKGSDGLKVTLPVLAVEQRQVVAVSSSTESSDKQNLVKPKNLLQSDNNNVKLAFSSTALLGLGGAVDFLFNYPYNCLEQQLSRISPIINGMDMLNAFNLGNKQEMEAKVKTILATVQNYQKPDGGFGYWPSSAEGRPYITAYALDIISQAKAKGYSFDDETLKKAIAYLTAYLAAPQKVGYYNADELLTTRAYAIYSLAVNGVNVSGHFNNMATGTGISVEAKVYLLKAAKALGMTQALNKLKTDILNYARQSNATMYFAAPQGNNIIYNSDIMLTAQVLEATLTAANGFSGEEKAVAWLLDNKNKQANWGNTITNAAVFNALSAYFNVREQKAPNFTAVFKVEGKKIFDATFIGRSTEEKAVTFGFDKIFDNSQNSATEISKTGDGRLYYNLAMNYYPASYKDSIAAGFSVEKQIKPLYANLGPMAAGHRAIIEITITTNQNRNFVVLEDFLPAGFEIIDTSLPNQSTLQTDIADNNSYYFDRVERYDDKLAAFADYLPAGTHKFSYIVQAVAAGQYALPATWVSQMYYPEVMGRTAGGELAIK